MNNVRKLYLSYTFNRTNVIILSASLLLIFILLNLFDFDVSMFDYYEDISVYHNDYLKFAIDYVLPIIIVVIVSSISIDHIQNNHRFDLIFSTKISSKALLKIKISVYLLLSFLYVTIAYIMIMLVGMARFKYFMFDSDMLKILFMMNFIGFEAVLLSLLIIRITKIGYSGIIVFLIFLIARIVGDINPILGSIIFLHINLFNKIAPLGLVPSFLFDIMYLVILITCFGKNELKLKN